MSCAGIGDEPCRAHAWWYAPRRRGRPVERCPLCREAHAELRRREQHRADYARRRARAGRDKLLLALLDSPCP